MKLSTTKHTFLLCLFALSLSFSTRAQIIDEVNVGEATDASELNPLTNFSATGSYINEYLYFSLIGTDKSTGDFVPLIAEKLPTISDDKRVYTYAVHPMAKFNNGKKITARDVLFSLKLVRNPYVDNSQKRVHYENIAGARITGERNIEISLKKGSSQGLRITGNFAILSEDHFDSDHQLEAVTFNDLQNPKTLPPNKLDAMRMVASRINAFAKSMDNYDPGPASSPYLLDDWTRNEEILLTYNKKFWGRKLDEEPNGFFKQNVANITIKIMDDEAKMRSAIFQEKLDLCTSVPPQLYFELSDIPKLHDTYEFQTPPSASYEYIGMNIKGKDRGRMPAFSDVQVRRALAHLVNVDLLMYKVSYGLGKRIPCEYPTYHQGAKNEALDLIKFDTDKALEMLKAAGWDDHDDNGLLDKEVDGETVTFVVECIFNSNRPQRRVIAEELQKTAQKLGILVSLVELPWKDYLSRLKKGEFDLCIGAWVADPNEDTYRQIWHSKNWGSGSNFVGFGDENSDHLIDQYDTEIDLNKRLAIGKQIQKKIYDAQPYIFLWANTQCIIVRKDFETAPVYNLSPGFWLGEWE